MQLLSAKNKNKFWKIYFQVYSTSVLWESITVSLKNSNDSIK
jgi:predicted transcriptional regulator YheO